MPRRCDDLALLLPSFRARVDVLLERLRARGLDPLVFETLRTAERADQLMAKGRSKNGALSMHCYGAAVDVISASAKWTDPKFFYALGEEAKRLGLTWGGDWKTFVDSPHVQAIPVRLQAAFRALPVEMRDKFVAGRLSMMPPPPEAP